MTHSEPPTLSSPSRSASIGAAPAGDGVPAPAPGPQSESGPGMGRGPAFVAVLTLLLWLVLFAGGILVDTEPYRYRISPGGVQALSVETPAAAAPAAPAPGIPADAAPGLLTSWFVVLLWFLPVNLALVCAVAGVLGAMGNRANLHHEGPDAAGRPTPDLSNPYLSAMLRGFFVYLFLISGLLLLDDAPFSNSTPGQYVRLAGFLSLFSFVVNYNPHIFSGLVTWAFHRIQVRGGQEEAPPGARQVHYARAETVEVASVSTVTETETTNAPAPQRPPE